MSESAATAVPAAAPAPARGLTWAIAWRNLWRNRRRTWLTAGGVAFAVFLVTATSSVQLGMYADMRNNATSLMTGHLQLQNTDYINDSRFEQTLQQATELGRSVAEHPRVQAVAPRVEGFVLVSSGERSFGALLQGVDFAAEVGAVHYLDPIDPEHWPRGDDQAIVGVAMARNLGLSVGDEIVVLGSGAEGGVAAMAMTVTAILTTGIADLDRTLVLVPIGAMQAAFGLGDEVHTIVVMLDDLAASAEVAGQLAEQLQASGMASERPLSVRTWQEVMPEVEQTITVDAVGGQIMYWIIMTLVGFSVVNTFIMTVFERTREFGMLMAIGMKPGKLVVLTMAESFCIWVVGTTIGLTLSVALILPLISNGIPLGDLEELATQMYVPTAIYPALTLDGLLRAPLVMLIGTQIAAILPATRIRRLRPVEALRVEA